MHTLDVDGGGPLIGEITVPGDKSVSHRSLMFSTLATGPSTVTGLLRSEDVRSTWGAMTALGARIEDDGTTLTVFPPDRLVEPTDVVDCGNSGTTMRLLTGLLAPEPLFAVLTGDHSLRGRPMGRVVKPLRAMGARIDGRDDGARAPLAIRGGQLTRVDHDLAIASAQVKSCLMLAGRHVGISVREPERSRDHTERLFRAMGADLTEDAEGWLHLAPEPDLRGLPIAVPGDVSSAAFFLVAASIVPGSRVLLRRVGLNPTRAGVVDALRQMGASIEVDPAGADAVEPQGDLVVRHVGLTGTRIDGELALRCLDELPVLAVAAAFAEGETVIADAAELRVKESDRIARVVAGLRAMQVEVEERPDGMVIQGGRPVGPAVVDARGDHRIAMAFAIAAAATTGGVRIEGADSIATSYPAFLSHLEGLRE